MASFWEPPFTRNMEYELKDKRSTFVTELCTNLIAVDIFVTVGIILLTSQMSEFGFWFVARETLPQWDKQIQSLCFQVNSIIEKINQHAPDWIASISESDMS